MLSHPGKLYYMIFIIDGYNGDSFNEGGFYSKSVTLIIIINKFKKKWIYIVSNQLKFMEKGLTIQCLLSKRKLL